MGSVQAKSSMNSPPRGLEKLKMDNGYVSKAAGRRSTGQRYPDKDSGRVLRPESGSNKVLFVSGDGGGEEKSINKEEKRDDGGSEVSHVKGKEIVDGWPNWLTDNIPKKALAGLVPRSAESFEKLDKIGQGTYSNVYKARDKDTGKIVALKKVRFETTEPESVKFMAREITILRELDHPNVIKLEGLVTSRMQYSLYLVFDFMQSDLARVIACPERLTEPQIKCYMHQLLSGLQHCHERGILHRDIKGSNLLIDKDGRLKIADFGLAKHFYPNRKHPLTSRVVTLWYRAPELLLGATDYGVGIDLWSAGCLLAEMFLGGPIMPGRTEVEQIHRIFKLCGTPSEEYWKKQRMPTTFRPPQMYKPSLVEAFRDFPTSSLGLLSTLLALDPSYRGSARSALQNEFFHTWPLACDLTGLPVIYKEDDEATQAREHRKHRRSKMKQHSQTGHRRKDPTAQKPKGDSGSSKEETEKSTERTSHSQESRNSTGSASSSARPTLQEESPPFLLSPVASSRQKMSPRTQDYPNAGNNIKNLPPLPNSKTFATNRSKENNNMYRSNHVHRSASTREFRNLDQRKHLKPYPLKD
ncbi:putative serine/threonine-protein kinase [Vitis vinifera]|uniref:Putative serine/threonine-protein kinase n=1 Tax=Vitis vinifera TaxID=29760 RepID=A0A438EMG1_VITVI|nr:putative serine/threonine-protein kinase [Vitis vinifera]